jgi:opacity protein-like surface antigen
VSAARVVAALALSVFAASAGAETLKVAVNKANLREAATAEAAVVAVLDAGTEVDVLEKTTEWWKVQVVSTGTIGYLKPVFLGVGGEPPAGERPRRTASSRRSGAPRAPRDYGRFRLDVGGAFGASGIDFTEDRTIRHFAEDGRIRTDYATDPGPGFEGGLLFRVTRHLGVSFAGSRVQHDGAASFEASIPHPLYLDQDREVSGSLPSVGQSETALHFDVVYTATKGRMDLHLFAGPTRMTVEADLLQDIQFTQTYPYDTLTVTGTPSQAVSGSAFGFNVGGGVDYRLGKSFGLGAQLRFSRAKAELVGAPGSTVSIDAGGLQVGLGARVIF